MSMDHKDFMLSQENTLMSDEEYYFTAVNLDRDGPDWEPDLDEEAEDDEDDDEQEDLEDDRHVDGGSQRGRASEDWSGYYSDLD